MKKTNLVICPAKEKTFSPRELALIARNFQPNAGMRCKGALSAYLNHEQFAEVWRIRALQAQRRDARCCKYYDTLHTLDSYDERAIKSTARKSVRRWGRAFTFLCDYRSHLAEPIQKSWQYKSRVKYHVSLMHSQTQVKYESNRPACSYETLDVTLTWDLLRHRWQWIGGMLTISAKTDAGKKAYPCWWFQQRQNADGPCVGLEVKHGWIINGNYHVSAVHSEEEARRKKASIIRRAKEKAIRDEAQRLESRRLREAEQAACKANDAIAEEKARKKLAAFLNRLKSHPINYIAPRGWVTRFMSIAAGNCRTGTDNFIASKIAPWFKKQGYQVGNMRGVALRVRTLLQIERSSYTEKSINLHFYEKNSRTRRALGWCRGHSD